MEIPDIRYARSGDVAIAYQVVGDGPVDLVFTPFYGNIRYGWELPLLARFYEGLAAFSRLILFDKRGMGLSDRPRLLTLETQMDDIRAVLDAVGSRRAGRGRRGHVYSFLRLSEISSRAWESASRVAANASSRVWVRGASTL